MLVLEGRQGAGKSQALAVLGGPWFSDEMATLGSKDAAMLARAGWIIEVAELDALGRSEATAIKSFLSRSVDRYRPPYGRLVVEQPRQCILIGTTNSQAYLKDETGGRRFWPVRVGTISLERLRNARDQLFAEAVARFRAGEPWWLIDRALVEAASHEQAARFTEDPWRATIEELVDLKADVSVDECLTAIGFEMSRRDQSAQNRVARILIAMGFERYQRREGERRTWRYRRL